MPVIEIASVNSPGLNLRQEDFEVTIIESNELRSHRHLFNDFFKNQCGTIIHVGNPDFCKEKGDLFYAGQLIDWDFEPVEVVYFPYCEHDSDGDKGGGNQQVRFRFLDRFRKDIDNILKAALYSSPVNKGFFLSVYHFGPDKNREMALCISDLWSHHDQEGLIFNTMYELCG